jgi:drug/metabolite transporter (DMT)-like permease
MFLLVGAALCWSLYAVNVQRAMRSYGARLGFGVVSLLVAPPLIGLMFAFGDWRAALHLRLSDWLLLALSGWVGIALGHVMYYRAVRSLGPVAAEGSLALMPFLTAVLAGLVLGEHMRASQWVGGSLLVISSMILVFTRVHPSPERAESEAPPGG